MHSKQQKYDKKKLEKRHKFKKKHKKMKNLANFKKNKFQKSADLCSVVLQRSYSFFTFESTCQTSLLRFCNAKVLKPICKLFKIAIKVVGPATVILNSERN